MLLLAHNRWSWPQTTVEQTIVIEATAVAVEDEADEQSSPAGPVLVARPSPLLTVLEGTQPGGVRFNATAMEGTVVSAVAVPDAGAAGP